MTNEYTIHEDAQHRAEMCKMLSGRIAELEAENRRLAANLYGVVDALTRCEGWRDRYWEERDQARAENQRKDAEIAQLKAPQPCGHPSAAIIATEARGNYCGWCAEVARLREALRDVEWACDDLYCPACGGYPEQGHNMWCDLAAILKERQP